MIQYSYIFILDNIQLDSSSNLYHFNLNLVSLGNLNKIILTLCFNENFNYIFDCCNTLKNKNSLLVRLNKYINVNEFIYSLHINFIKRYIDYNYISHNKFYTLLFRVIEKEKVMLF